MKTYIVPDVIEAVSLLHLCILKQCYKCIKLHSFCCGCELLTFQYAEISKANSFHKINDLPM